MVWRHSKLSHGVLMLNRRIAFILLPIIVRILIIKLFHNMVTSCLCQDRSRCDNLIFSVTAHNALMLDIFIFIETISVDKKQLRPDFQLVDGAMHSQKRCVEDVYLVDFLSGNDANTISRSVF